MVEDQNPGLGFRQTGLAFRVRGEKSTWSSTPATDNYPGSLWLMEGVFLGLPSRQGNCDFRARGVCARPGGFCPPGRCRVENLAQQVSWSPSLGTLCWPPDCSPWERGSEIFLPCGCGMLLTGQGWGQDSFSIPEGLGTPGRWPFHYLRK